MTKRVFIVIFLLGLTLGLRSVVAQDNPDEIAKKYGISFPVSELGGCKDYYECRNYCEDPLHYNSCTSFAKKKGFYKEQEYKPDERILNRATQVLGCSSYGECRDFCGNEKNFDRCDRFAQSVGVVGGYKEDPRSAEFLSKAKETLKCSSYDSCRNFCENPANRDRCAEFARKIGVSGGYEYKGPGGCTTEETCRAFCESPSNVDICRGYSEAHGGRFIGPGGCSDEVSCTAYCEKNPSSCSRFEEASYNKAEYCSKTPSCSWTGSNCQCSSTEIYGGDPAAECSKYGCSWSGSYCQCEQSSSQYQERLKSECSKYPSCSWTGDRCGCSSTPVNYQEDPATQCSKYEGCSWQNNSCQCSGSSSPSGGSTYDPATECAKQTGCSWSGSSCQCSAPSESSTAPSYDPATECARQSGCSWTGSSCQCSSTEWSYSSPTPGVYGATTTRSLLEKFLQFILSR